MYLFYISRTHQNRLGRDLESIQVSDLKQEADGKVYLVDAEGTFTPSWLFDDADAPVDEAAITLCDERVTIETHDPKALALIEQFNSRTAERNTRYAVDEVSGYTCSEWETQSEGGFIGNDVPGSTKGASWSAVQSTAIYTPEGEAVDELTYHGSFHKGMDAVAIAEKLLKTWVVKNVTNPAKVASLKAVAALFLERHGAFVHEDNWGNCTKHTCVDCPEIGLASTLHPPVAWVDVATAEGRVRVDVNDCPHACGESMPEPSTDGVF